MSKDYSTEIQINGNKNGGLTASDYDNFSRSFITPEIVEAAGIYRVNDEQGAEILCRKRQAGKDYSGLVFPYRNDLTGDVLEYEIRRDNPDKETVNGREKIKGKYLRPNKSKSFLYFVPKTNPEHLKDAFTMFIISEGAKKPLAMLNALTDNLQKPSPFLLASISGVDNFKTSQKQRNDFGGIETVSDVLPQIKNINLAGREVLIVFDPNVLTNANVYFARHRLAETLLSLGAVVYYLNLPILTDERGEKLDGIDDILGFWERTHGREKAVEKFNELFRQKRKFVKTAVFSRPLCNENLTLKIENGERNKLKVSALDASGNPIEMDLFNPSDAAKRNAFLSKQIFPAFSPSDDDKKEITAELLRLAALAEIVTVYDKKQMEESDGETIETSFKELSDGRIVEQIRGGFALYNPESGEYEIVQTVVDSDGTTYKPIADDLFNQGGLYVADDLTEYGSTDELDTAIENYLSTYIDLKPLQLKMAAKYARFTFLFDKVLELPYINATGDSGAGKSRFGGAEVMICRRGLYLITPSAASVYRIAEKFHPTMFFDEFNGNDSDDAAAIIQILNAGYQKTGKIARQLGKGDGDFQTQLFDPYCPKIIGSLKQAQSQAFNSRCIPVEMERTTRNDIPLRLTPKMLRDAQEIQNKLTLYRLRHYSDDLENRLFEAEKVLKENSLINRTAQVNIPLFAIIEDEETRGEYIALLKGHDKVLIEQKQQTIDGEIVDLIHAILFDEDENGIKWNSRNIDSAPEQDKVCEALTTERLHGAINAKRQKEIEIRYFGKLIIGLGLHTKKILRRDSDHRDKKAIVFDYNRLSYLFKMYDLNSTPEFQKFNVTNVTKTDKPNADKRLGLVTLEEKNADAENQCHQTKQSNNSTYGGGDIGDIKNHQISPNGKKYVRTEI